MLTACTSEDIQDNELISQKPFEKGTLQSTKRFEDARPENPQNPIDIAGKIHNDILDAYLSANYQFNTIEQISQKIDSISGLNIDYKNLEANVTPKFYEIQNITDNPQDALEMAISGSMMASNAQSCLSNFIVSLNVWETNEYDFIYRHIVSFENSVINNPQFNSREKNIILTTSSIARYSLFYSRKRKDKDWETSVGNRVGAVQGAMVNPATAVNRSIIAGLMTQNSQP